MAHDPSSNVTFGQPLVIDVRVSAFLRAVYGWMCVGLAITALTASYVASSPSIVTAIATNRLLFWGIVIAQFGIVITLSARVQKLAASTASILFIAYSALTGVTISFVLLAYTGESVGHRRFSSPRACSARSRCYGTTTRRSLAGIGQFLFMGLIGVVLASSSACSGTTTACSSSISFIGVIVFTGLDRLRRAAAEGDGARHAGRPGELVRHRRRAGALPRLHQPVLVPVALHGQPPRAGLAAPTALAHPASAFEDLTDRPLSGQSSAVGCADWKKSKESGDCFRLGFWATMALCRTPSRVTRKCCADTRLPRHARSGEKALSTTSSTASRWMIFGGIPDGQPRTCGPGARGVQGASPGARLMRILLDECADQRLRLAFTGHDCQTAGYATLSDLKNGALLTAAEAAGFERNGAGLSRHRHEAQAAGRHQGFAAVGGR